MNTKTDVWREGYRVFLSHESRAKAKAAKLKTRLEFYGVTAFLAHKDIHPTRLWEKEIEKALVTMDAFVPLLTEKFHKSDWTDQEIGYALCRDVPIIPVRLGTDPYGFIGRFQAITSGWNKAPLEIVRILVDKDPAMTTSFIRMVENCESYDDGNRLAEILDYITELTDEQVKQLISAFNDNYQVSGSFGFNEDHPNRYGEGLASHLKRITGQEYYTHKHNHNLILAEIPF